MAGDERALGGDLLIDRIETGARGAGLGLRGDPGGLGLGDDGTQSFDLGPRILDHLGRHAGRSILRLGLRAEQGKSLVRHRVEVAEPLLHRLEPERGAARDIHVVADLRLLETGDPQLLLFELLLQHDALAVPFALGAAVRVESGAQRDDLVGEQPGARIPHDGRDGLRFTRDLGLVSERLQLAPDLAREIAEARQVGLHRLELAQGLLLAPAVLQDARRLFDETASILRARVQHSIQLALADDDVHLAAETRVAEELLDVEQTAGLCR